jgi:hypothetical protein
MFFTTRKFYEMQFWDGNMRLYEQDVLKIN